VFVTGPPFMRKAIHDGSVMATGTGGARRVGGALRVGGPGARPGWAALVLLTLAGTLTGEFLFISAHLN